MQKQAKSFASCTQLCACRSSWELVAIPGHYSTGNSSIGTSCYLQQRCCRTSRPGWHCQSLLQRGGDIQLTDWSILASACVQPCICLQKGSCWEQPEGIDKSSDPGVMDLCEYLGRLSTDSVPRRQGPGNTRSSEREKQACAWC